jgi:hypothetical protein
MMMTMAACTVAASSGEEPAVPERGTGRTCDSSKAQSLVGRVADDALAAEAMRLTGAGALRWVPMGAMVTMDYRPDRLNIHLGPKNEVTKVACG